MTEPKIVNASLKNGDHIYGILKSGSGGYFKVVGLDERKLREFQHTKSLSYHKLGDFASMVPIGKVPSTCSHL